MICYAMLLKLKTFIMTTIFVGTVNGPVMKEKDMNEAYVLLKNAIVSKKFLVQVIIETVPVSNHYRNYEC